MIIQLFIILFVLFVLLRIVSRFRQGDITGRELAIWAGFWFLVAIAALLPAKTDVLAAFLGVERGADLLIYVSVIVLFFIIFKVLVKLEKLDKQITKIVRQQALNQVQKPEEKNE